MEQREGLHRGTVLLVVYFVMALLPALLLVLTGQMKTIVPFHAAARFFAVTGFTLLLLQPLLAARFKWIERPVGLDRIFAFHRITGMTAAVFAVLHPVMLALGSKSFAILTSFDSPWQISIGRIALLVLLLFGAAAVFRAGLKIPFQLWFRMHNAVTPVIVGGVFIHSWFTAVRFMPLPLRILWFILLFVSLYSYLHLTVYQRLTARKKSFSVSSVNPVTGNIWEIEMIPPKGSTLFRYLPGQFLFLTFLRGRGLPVEEHPFTISSSPSERDHIAVAVKESGDFTLSIGRTKPGDRAAILAPYGRFSYLLHRERKRLVFIAGGIGVTPLLSMLRYMAHLKTGKDTTLFYANRTEADIAFREELEAIAGSSSLPRLNLVHILSKPGEAWKGERGRVNCSLMKKHLGSLDETGFYICGPPPMMDSIAAELLLNGVAGSDVHMEKFAL